MGFPGSSFTTMPFVNKVAFLTRTSGRGTAIGFAKRVALVGRHDVTPTETKQCVTSVKVEQIDKEEQVVNQVIKEEQVQVLPVKTDLSVETDTKKSLEETVSSCSSSCSSSSSVFSSATTTTLEISLTKDGRGELGIYVTGKPDAVTGNMRYIVADFETDGPAFRLVFILGFHCPFFSFPSIPLFAFLKS